MKLIALKKLRYPSGPAGKEYVAGDEFTALSERDRKALTLVRAAKDVDAKEPAAPRGKAMKAEAPAPAAPQLGLGGTSEEPKRTYKRRDMVSEG